MTARKFAPGDRVSVQPGRFDAHVRPGIYTIVRVLPETPSGWQYRVKNALDPHERVLDEAQLRSA